MFLTQTPPKKAPWSYLTFLPVRAGIVLSSSGQNDCRKSAEYISDLGLRSVGSNWLSVRGLRMLWRTFSALHHVVGTTEARVKQEQCQVKVRVS